MLHKFKKTPIFNRNITYLLSGYPDNKQKPLQNGGVYTD